MTFVVSHSIIFTETNTEREKYGRQKITKVTQENYDTVWEKLEVGDIITWSKQFAFHDMKFHCRRITDDKKSCMQTGTTGSKSAVICLVKEKKAA
ncbi:MAG: hypothetical protein AN483_12700 [Aphanizomenon flos-aquae MDT14a]|nr:MAG: hypothetical protein AN483_12700 [Aphanizomenon flos-aquae MDT14a]